MYLKFRKNCGARCVKNNTDIGLSSLLILDVANSEVEDVGREPVGDMEQSPDTFYSKLLGPMHLLC